MISVCPQCLKQVEHEDHLFEVACSCGARFNPFDIPAMDAPITEGAPASPAEDFTESNSTFQEIRDFGETLGADSEVREVSLSKKKNIVVQNSGTPVVSAAAPVAESQTLMLTSTEKFEGFKVDHYLGVVSGVIDLDYSSENPLGPVIDHLSRQATARGGNGILSFRWSLTPDGAKAIASGSAVRCARCE